MRIIRALTSWSWPSIGLAWPLKAVQAAPKSVSGRSSAQTLGLLPPRQPHQEKQDRVSFGDYNSFAELLPECPDRLLGVCSRLKGGSHSLCLRKKIRCPRATLPIDLKPAVYIIVQARGLSAPTRVSRASDLARITGKFCEETICHGFPSLAEAEVYCAALGITVPCQHQFQ